MAPLDSINQASGRCNRNNYTQGMGRVYVVSLKDENNRKYSSYVYDPVLLDITKRILGKHLEIEEQKFLGLIDEYYKETSAKKAQEESRNILEAIEKMRYDSEDSENISISDFKLIEEDYSKKDVFVETNDDAKAVWIKYTKIWKIKDLLERKKSFDAMKSDFYKYVISIPAKVENPPPEVGFLCYVKNAILADYYNPETGFITKDNRSLTIW